MELCGMIVIGQEALRGRVNRLIDMSVWFQVTPLPDDNWRVCVKAGDDHALTR